MADDRTLLYLARCRQLFDVNQVPSPYTNHASATIPPPFPFALSPFSFSESVETTRCCDRLWHVRLGGVAGARPLTPPELHFLPLCNGPPRLSSQLVRQVSGRWCWLGALANMSTDGKKVSIEGSVLLGSQLVHPLLTVFCSRFGFDPSMREGRSHSPKVCPRAPTSPLESC